MPLRAQCLWSGLVFNTASGVSGITSGTVAAVTGVVAQTAVELAVTNVVLSNP